MRTATRRIMVAQNILGMFETKLLTDLVRPSDHYLSLTFHYRSMPVLSLTVHCLSTGHEPAAAFPLPPTRYQVTDRSGSALRILDLSTCLSLTFPLPFLDLSTAFP